MDRRIDERFRKPRRTKGTPLYIQRNYIAAALLAVGGFCWFLLELTPGATFIKSNRSELLEDSEETKLRRKQLQSVLNSPNRERLFYKIRERIALKDEPKEQNWLAKCCLNKPGISKYFISQTIPTESYHGKLQQIETQNSNIILNDSIDDFLPTSAPLIDKQKNVTKWEFSKVAAKNSNSKKKRRKKIIGSDGTIQQNLKCVLNNLDCPQEASQPKTESVASYSKESFSDSGIFNHIYSKPSCLEKYGFKSAKVNVKTDSIPISKSEIKIKQKSRFNVITPILKIRSKVERDAIILSKISVILSSQPPANKERQSNFTINSCNLQNFLSKNNKKIFSTDAINNYVASLEIEKSNRKNCGQLLKNWESIPGTEDIYFIGDNGSNKNYSLLLHTDEVLSSNAKFVEQSIEDINHLNTERSGSLSPDIFQSDNENFVIPEAEKENDENNTSTCTESERRNTNKSSVSFSDFNSKFSNAYSEAIKPQDNLEINENHSNILKISHEFIDEMPQTEISNEALNQEDLDVFYKDESMQFSETKREDEYPATEAVLLAENSLMATESFHDGEFKNLDENCTKAIVNNWKSINGADMSPSINITMKTENITPMRNYNRMSSPALTKELEKFGLKPMKRKRSVYLLNHIYHTTHPVVETIKDNDENTKVMKKRKKMIYSEKLNSSFETDDFIFECNQNSKISSCCIPLHIVWHNLLISNEIIREKVLSYEPIELESLHMMLKEQGFNFRIQTLVVGFQDLLDFLNQKCIRVKKKPL